MHKRFEINRTKNKGSCQSGRKVVTHDTNSDFPLSGIIRIGLMFDQKMFAFLSKKFFLLSSSAVFEKFLNQLRQQYWQ